MLILQGSIYQITIMAHQTYQLEFPLGQVSLQQVWLMLSTARGLSCWIDAKVTFDKEIATFQWTPTSADKARIYIRATQAKVRFNWLHEEGGFEMRIESSEITKDLSLIILDECETEDYDSSVQIWNRQVNALYRCLGLVARS